MHSWQNATTAALLALTLGAACHNQPPPATGPPPVPPSALVAHRPNPGFEWVDGYWRWTGRRWKWVAGAWEAERTGQRWVAGHWTWTDDGQQCWQQPHWEALKHQATTAEELRCGH